MGNFYSRLSYSFGNEDWRTEHKALKIQPSDRVLCVTGSGDRPLNLLTADLQEVITIDANPIQNALFDLKKAAMSNLPIKDYSSFLGINPYPNRLDLYHRIASKLDPISNTIWKTHSDKIGRGIVYEGTLEKCLKKTACVLRLFRKKKIDTLFGFDELDKQSEFLKKKWHSYFFKTAFSICLNPFLSRMVLGDPGLYDHVDSTLRVGSHLFELFHASLHRFLAKENIVASLVLQGFVDKQYLPPYLSEKDIEIIKSRLNRVRFKTIDLIEYLEKSPPNYFDCFSLSDVASYMSREDFNRMIRAIHKTAKPKARFCLRQFLSKHQIPASHALLFKRDRELEHNLEQEDRCFVYQFMVGTIGK